MILSVYTLQSTSQAVLVWVLGVGKSGPGASAWLQVEAFPVGVQLDEPAAGPFQHPQPTATALLPRHRSQRCRSRARIASTLKLARSPRGPRSGAPACGACA